MNLCSMVLNARPAQAAAVRTRLEAIEGVEVHAVSDTGRLVLTLEHPDRTYYAETMMQMHNVAGVLSAALIYEFHDEQEVTQKEVSQ
ncbi:chaperone NapD [Thioalbus denitrificans]|uniref:Chaperone NapD n=1 Tax=Thioalbus denitrificans TaxID=547122 RepID=A0A369CI13_9GAMM|nr:chaperone NapD [Thioalbus denitrificans]RCX32918.1 periplasmic nitrate reductase chaperone NapD [Thioalbus denitrificans]